MKEEWVCGILKKEYRHYYLEFFATEKLAKIKRDEFIKELRESNDEGEVAVMKIVEIVEVSPKWKENA